MKKEKIHIQKCLEALFPGKPIRVIYNQGRYIITSLPVVLISYETDPEYHEFQNYRNYRDPTSIRIRRT